MKLFSTFLFLLILQLGFSQDRDVELKNDIQKLIRMGGVSTQVEIVKEQFLKSIPNEKQKKFRTDFESLLPKLYDDLVKIYLKTYTKEDIQAMIVFYESPVGKKITATSAEVGNKSALATQLWVRDVEQIAFKYSEE